MTGEGAPAHLQVVADRAGAEAGPDREAARAAVRRQGTVPARGDGGDLVARGAEGHGRRRRVHRRRAIRSSRPGLIKATVGALTGEARARVVRPLPWTETFEALRRRRGAAGLGQRHRRQVLGRRRSTARRCCRRRRTNTIFKRVRVVHRPGRLVELHRSRPTSARRRGAGRWATSASPRSATRWCSTATRSG